MIHPWLTLVFVLAAASLSLGCADKQGVPHQSDRGFVQSRFVDKHGRVHQYLVYLPHDYEPGQRRPLLLFLNGLMENGDDGYRSISNNFGVHIWEMKLDFPFVCAIPQCAVGQTWDGEQLDLAIEFAEEVQRRYGTDPDRLCITGVSLGGTGVWNALAAYPERFAAAVPMCGTVGLSDQQLASISVPIWNFYNADDQPHLVQENRDVRQHLLGLGLSPIATEYDLSGHNCWDAAYRSIGLYQWLMEQRRPNGQAEQRYIFRTPAELIVGAAVSDGGATSKHAAWQITSDGELECMDAAGDHLLPVITTNDLAVGHVELHVDSFIAASGSNCRFAVTALNRDSQQPGVFEIILSPADAGIGGVRTQDGQWMAELAPAAQHQLRPGRYNDIRILATSGALQVWINGWKAIEMQDPWPAEQGYALAISGTAGTRWKNIRTRACP